ncbi:MAG TPA: N-acetyltransferase [Marmoricola sp.]|nr:N-acetyltransferase [Marmoricola sp.]
MFVDLPPTSDLPPGFTPRVPGPEDVPALTALVATYQRSSKGSSSVDQLSVGASVVGPGSWTRQQLVLDGPDGRLVAWVTVHDRAAGRTMVDLTVVPDCPEGDHVARVLLAWAEEAARELAGHRALGTTQLDATVFAGDERQQRWLTAAGYRQVRTWLNMTRPVSDADEFPGPRAGVTIRRVAEHEDGMPVAADLQVVHRMLEESFADHFNSYRESFAEFVQRLREDPGHRWDHWFIAEVEVEGATVPGGALVSSVLPADQNGVEGSYVDYIGVHRRARGLGVAKALLGTVIRDARARERNRVDLEVDADSPTGADGLYRAMGWVEKYRTESWHGEARV